MMLGYYERNKGKCRFKVGLNVYPDFLEKFEKFRENEKNTI